MNQPSISMTSPGVKLPNSNQLLYTFAAALEQAMAGKRITRKDWPEPKAFGYFKDHVLLLNINGIEHTWIISDGDVTAEDWYTIV